MQGLPITLSFQFQCGAIGRWERHMEKQPNSSFNSSVVRLGGKSFDNKSKYYKKFQFQCGAIGRNESASCLTRDPCFNSSVVRLGVVVHCEGAAVLRVSIPVWCDWENELLAYAKHLR